MQILVFVNIHFCRKPEHCRRLYFRLVCNYLFILGLHSNFCVHAVTAGDELALFSFGGGTFLFPKRRFLGTSGQNVGDIQKYSSMDSHLEILEETLRLRHLAPTAPDTLGESSGRGFHPPGPVGIVHTVPSSPYQVVIRSTKKTRSFWRNVPTSTSAATPPPLDPS